MEFKVIVSLIQNEEGQQIVVKSEPQIGTIEALGMLEAAKEYVIRIGLTQEQVKVSEEISD